MTKYFASCRTLDELKKLYKAAAMKYHPDLVAANFTSRASEQSSDACSFRCGSSSASNRSAGLQAEIEKATATMQAINAEYEARFEVLKRSQNAQAAEDPTGRTRATAESAGDFIAIINHLLRMDGLEIELCGRWLWIGGNTKAHKDELKACGCRWSSAKKLWSWHFQEDGDHWHRGKQSMSQIRTKYGSTTFTRGGPGSDALPA